MLRGPSSPDGVLLTAPSFDSNAPADKVVCLKMKDAAVLDRRAKLLGKVADYILSKGLAGLSLRPLAATINTSPRMLLYFFGSKERLIAEALAHIRTRE